MYTHTYVYNIYMTCDSIAVSVLAASPISRLIECSSARRGGRKARVRGIVFIISIIITYVRDITVGRLRFSGFLVARPQDFSISRAGYTGRYPFAAAPQLWFSRSRYVT